MVDKEELFKKMQEAIFNYDKDLAVKLAKEAIEAGIDPLEAIEKGFAVAIRELGEKFDRMEIFLPELIMGADAMKAAVDILKEEIVRRGQKVEKKGVVVIGTVEGDIHDIGKTIVIAMLQSAGFDVYDLGKDVPIPRFLQAAEEVNADIIAASALLTTTMMKQRDLIEYLKSQGKRDKYFVIVGGAPCSQKWADEIGADGYARDAIEAVKLCERLMEQKKKKGA
ncbi:MAG: corrinoid protein [Candidatus Odinarchaeota archaeon]|nr:corrinoid protein [Candidatus Odinarchaeota archaeon]